MNYLGLIHKDKNSDYGVSFPDFPGVITAGKDLDDARDMAEEALALHIEGLLEDGESIPSPSSLEEIMADPANTGAVAILVTATTGTVKRVNITMPELPKEQPPAVLVEWQAAVQAWADAMENNQPIKAAQARARKAWLAIKDDPRLETTPEVLKLMDELMRPMQ